MTPSARDSTLLLADLLPCVRRGFGAWATFIAGTCAYCLLHQAFVSAVTPNLPLTLTVALREWGAWALLAPWALHVFREPMCLREVLLRCALLALLAASLPIVIDLITADRDLSSSFFLFWPRNFAMAAAFLFVARATSRPVAAMPAIAPSRRDESPATLLVSKGADQCLIRVDDIHYLSASGNYIDICAANQRYLMRATLGDLEMRLPQAHFVRIHRSHMVRVREIERIRVERSGSGTVLLRGGAALPISRTYRARLKAQQAESGARMH